jgi:hypothetical protein
MAGQSSYSVVKVVEGIELDFSWYSAPFSRELAMRRIATTLSFALLACLALNSGAFAKVVQKPGFSISLPDGWVEIPQSVLRAAEKELGRQAPNAKTIPKYDYGFQSGGAKTWMRYPYILIQVNNTGRIPESELKSLTKIKINDDIRGTVDNFKSVISNLAIGQMQYDEAAHIIWMTSQSDVVRIGKVRGLSGIIPTDKGTLAIHGYSLERNFQSFAPIFRQIVKSTSVSQQPTYEPSWKDNIRTLSRSEWGLVKVSLLVGVICGAIGGCLGAFIAAVRSMMQHGA